MTRPGAEVAGEPVALRPRSDGRRVLFEVEEGGRTVACAISQHALRDVATAASGRAGRRGASPGDLMQCFVAARPKIEALALRAIRARRGALQGTLYVWPDDEDEPPEPAAPAVALEAEPQRRTG